MFNPWQYWFLSRKTLFWYDFRATQGYVVKSELLWRVHIQKQINPISNSNAVPLLYNTLTDTSLIHVSLHINVSGPWVPGAAPPEKNQGVQHPLEFLMTHPPPPPPKKGGLTILLCRKGPIMEHPGPAWRCGLFSFLFLFFACQMQPRTNIDPVPMSLQCLLLLLIWPKICHTFLLLYNFIFQ